MRLLLFIVGLLSGLFSLVVLASAKSNLHEIYAAICALTAVTALAGAGIIEAVQQLKKVVEDNTPPRP